GFGGPRASRGAAASPGRPERLGGLGGPARRGAPRLRRGDPSVWGVWGAPRVEGRHGFAGATRAFGGFGGPRASRGATASPGRPEPWGGWGAPRGQGRHG